MDSEARIYLDKFTREEVNFTDAQQKRVELAEKEARHLTNMKAALQLLLDRVRETNEALPQDLLIKAGVLVGSQSVNGLRAAASVESTTAAKEEPVFGTAHQNDDSSVTTSEGSSGNLVQWINDAIAASGVQGLTPPEILKKAESLGIKMHENYPYTVLRKLLAAGKIRKENRRYFQKQKGL
jgi:hypothetical protein